MQTIDLSELESGGHSAIREIQLAHIKECWPLSSFRPPMAISRIVRLNQSPEDPAPHGLHLTEEAGRSA